MSSNYSSIKSYHIYPIPLGKYTQFQTYDEKYRIYKERCSASAWASGTGDGNPMGAHLRYSATTMGRVMSVEWTDFPFSEESVRLGEGHRVRIGDIVVPDSCIEV